MAKKKKNENPNWGIPIRARVPAEIVYEAQKKSEKLGITMSDFWRTFIASHWEKEALKFETHIKKDDIASRNKFSSLQNELEQTKNEVIRLKGYLDKSYSKDEVVNIITSTLESAKFRNKSKIVELVNHAKNLLKTQKQ